MIPDTMNRQLGNLLTDTILRFCRKHHYFDEELKVQGTICITSDASAFLVTQISDRFHETPPSDVRSDVTAASPVTLDGTNRNANGEVVKVHNLVVREANQIKAIRGSGTPESPMISESKTNCKSVCNDVSLQSDGQPEYRVVGERHGDFNAYHRDPIQQAECESDDEGKNGRGRKSYPLDSRPVRTRLLNQPIKDKTERGYFLKKNRSNRRSRNYAEKSCDAGSSPSANFADDPVASVSRVKTEVISDDEHEPQDPTIKQEPDHLNSSSELSFTFSDEMAIGSYVQGTPNPEDMAASTGLDFLTPQYASFQAAAKAGMRSANFGSNAASTYVQRTFDGKYGCTLCHMEYSNRGTLQRHIEARHLGRNYTCVLCHMTFESHSGWSRHLRTKHSQHMPLECDVCGEKFKLTMALEQHMRRKHPATDITASKMQEVDTIS